MIKNRILTMCAYNNDASGMLVLAQNCPGVSVP